MEGEGSSLHLLTGFHDVLPPPLPPHTHNLEGPDRGTQLGDALGYSTTLPSDSTARAVPCSPQRGLWGSLGRGHGQG